MHTLPKFNSLPQKSYQNPVGKDRFPTTMFHHFSGFFAVKKFQAPGPWETKVDLLAFFCCKRCRLPSCESGLLRNVMSYTLENWRLKLREWRFGRWFSFQIGWCWVPAVNLPGSVVSQQLQNHFEDNPFLRGTWHLFQVTRFCLGRVENCNFMLVG